MRRAVGRRDAPSDPAADGKKVRIFADHDVKGQGLAAAQAAKRRWTAEGREVAISISPIAGEDANDILLKRLGRGPSMDEHAADSVKPDVEDDVIDAVDPLANILEKTTADPGAPFAPEIWRRSPN